MDSLLLLLLSTIAVAHGCVPTAYPCTRLATPVNTVYVLPYYLGHSRDVKAQH